MKQIHEIIFQMFTSNCYKSYHKLYTSWQQMQFFLLDIDSTNANIYSSKL